MRLLHNIGDRPGSNYNTRDQVRDCKDALSFDGVYLNVYENRDLLVDKDVIFFVMGNYVGMDNSFDKDQLREKLCTWHQLEELENYGRLGWHSWSHRDLRTLDDYELKMEVMPPFPMEDFAYPHGVFDERVIEAVKAAGYKRAWCAGEHGDGSDYQLKREYL